MSKASRPKAPSAPPTVADPTVADPTVAPPSVPQSSIVPPAAAPPPAEQARRTRRRAYAIVAVAGANLSLIHFVTLTEFPSLLGSNELVALIILSAYFLGLSGGYLVSDRISAKGLLAIGLPTLALHASLPFSARWFAGTMWRVNLPGNTLPFLFLLVLVGISPFYAVFLPRLIDSLDHGAAPPSANIQSGSPSNSLIRLYAIEIAGSIGGLLVSVALSPARIRWILAAHLAGLVTLIVLWAAPRRRAWIVAGAALPVVYALLYPSLDRSSLAYFYKNRKGYSDIQILASEFSPYQRVDIFKGNKKNRTPSTYLYLNGNLLYGSTSLHQHNLAVSIMPNLMIPHPSNALVIAGGSLDAARYLAPRVGHLRVVEIDATVVRLAREQIQEPRGGFPTNWDLSVDDGKHFLGTWSGEPFDVISVDVPVPTYLQTAMLHSERFFELARTRLARGGIFSISLSGSLSSGHFDNQDDWPLSSHLAQRVMAGLGHTFKHVKVVQVDGRDFAWASDDPLPFGVDEIEKKTEAFIDSLGDSDDFEHPRIKVVDEEVARKQAEGFAPIGEADMQIVLRMSISKLYDRFYEPHFD